MFHPLVDNLKKLKDQELESKIIELSQKYNSAARLGQGGVCEQIIAILDMYREERSKRYKESFESTHKKDGQGLDDLINVD
jgi:hypothetical protein